ncbi:MULTISPECIES: EutN/CcmL family microcompartment protein [Desulfatibacillum]|jgi:ethanolamine utilization protein EutN|uniref:Ethanolamine utilization protein EutN n=1 Tax=Desulfatibacillum alkenivorans DSM 16219 TaxID=1121393 RepID=A0A1M6YTA0_9BACT|nr:MULTISPECIES: EutN/CcmL family microcompartment protein [Desulfatibacillum]SHL21534.1 ethanolamine utilization protein EutN [Desulfatibacillum alkenivorans DSM 16219]
MILGQVIGTVVATSKHELLVGSKILVVQAVQPDGTPIEGELLVAVDTVGAGTGEHVIVTTGSNASKACETEKAPVDAAIIGIIDEIDVN